jgi:adenosylcobyric acid synthase
MSARCVMVLGTTSGAGKSWLATALCRWYARQGLKVAPFKAQNMSNNARVVAGGEIGSAQYFQALAAGAEPDVRMNPLLLKPERDTHSQVVLLGRVDEALSRQGWRGRSASVWPQVSAALDELRATHDVVVIEGAGSPAEINLKAGDIVNMRTAVHADARCLLVTDIDRGGAFAHLYGTWALLPEDERRRIRGFVLNKFRGDASLLAPAPQELERMTGIPTVAVLPMWWGHGLPEEDGWFGGSLPAGDAAGGSQAGVPPPQPSPRGGRSKTGQPSRTGATGQTTTIAIVAYPRISNLDEFQPLAQVPGVRLRWVRSPVGLDGADWVVLPGSKHTSGDLAWLREQGLDAAVAAHAARGGAVLGICGGLQMLGEALVDPHGIDGNAPGLGLLPLVTAFERDKTVRRTQARFGDVRGCWSALAGVTARGYEIHHGQTAQHPAMAPAHAAMESGLAWQNAAGHVLGVYLHGLFEDPRVLRALFGAQAPDLEATFDRMADFAGRHFAAGVLQDLIA